MPRKPPPARRPAPAPKHTHPERWAGKPKPVWLSRALARAGVLPGDEAEEAIRAGRVTLNGKVVRQPGAP
ncbi:MAG TPA: S4 domain-containing protein, partial [Myxococcaceae bacterium]|nr:S4 domain-containing protein [Myxococcaceae bacterium]